MFCPKCASDQSDVTESRKTATTQRRRRRCKVCYTRWTTFEVNEDTTLAAFVRFKQLIPGICRELRENLLASLELAFDKDKAEDEEQNDDANHPSP